jgi:hypothetical protein
MKKRQSRSISLAVLAVLLTVATLAAATTPPAPSLAGNWEGAMDTPNGAYKILIHVTEKDGALTGTLDSPDQNVNGLPITTISVKGATLHFEVKSVNGNYDGKFNADNSQISGEWKGMAGDMPLIFKRGAK